MEDNPSQSGVAGSDNPITIDDFFFFFFFSITVYAMQRDT